MKQNLSRHKFKFFACYFRKIPKMSEHKNNGEQCSKNNIKFQIENWSLSTINFTSSKLSRSSLFPSSLNHQDQFYLIIRLTSVGGLTIFLSASQFCRNLFSDWKRKITEITSQSSFSVERQDGSHRLCLMD